MTEWQVTRFENWAFHHPQPLREGAEIILALHGFTGSGLDFRPLAEHAGSPKALWAAPDLPGHGTTGVLDVEASSLDAMAEVLERFVGIYKLRPHVLGYSMGARLALHWALRGNTRFRSLTLVGGTAGIADDNERAKRKAQDNALAAHIRRTGTKAFAEEWEQRPIISSQERIPAEILKAMKARRRNHPAEGLARSLEAAGTGAMTPLWEMLPSLSNPLLIIAGEEDSKFVRISETLTNAVPIVKFHLIPLVGHCAHLEDSTSFLSEFAKQVANQDILPHPNHSL
jgi:2-succinyl-6-hydroxy-2,4-cyclohexadiene-1-carboxylate synthase